MQILSHEGFSSVFAVLRTKHFLGKFTIFFSWHSHLEQVQISGADVSSDHRMTAQRLKMRESRLAEVEGKLKQSVQVRIKLINNKSVSNC
jgi:hypothetical protein